MTSTAPDVEPEATGRSDRHTVARSVVDDADQLQLAYRRFGIEPLRVGPSEGPTKTLSVTGRRITFTSSKLGFPTLTSATFPDHCVSVAFAPIAPSGTRWSEFDIEPGATMVWSPSAEHHAANRPGLHVMAALLPVEDLEAVADQVGIGLRPLPPGQARPLAPDAGSTEAIGRALSNYGEATSSDVVPGRVYEDDLLVAVARALAGDEARPRTHTVNRIDSRAVVRACLDYAESIGRVPAISELCLAAHVSERRLRQAFVEEYDTPPSQFFRVWALAAAHRRLDAHDSSTASVTEVALDLGFEHLGRFAGSYRKVYGEAPSMTLRIGSNP